jgi:hypothetical protein
MAFDVVNQKWYVELDDQDDDDEYLIAYDAVCEYSNKQPSTFDQYQLPSELVLEGDDEIETEDGTLCLLTPTEEWSRVDNDEDGGRSIDMIEWTGGSEEFSVSITDAEVNTLKDDSMKIRYEKVFEWALPRFGDDDNESLFEFQAARMQNCIRKRIVEDGWIPKYYVGDWVITTDHVTRFYGACLAKMFMGNRSINQIFCTGEIFNAVPSIQAAMTKNAMEDLTGCLHYSDDWDLMGNGVWSDTHDDPKVVADPSTVTHRLKHGWLEDGYNKRWQAIVHLGKWITTDVSRVAGWYHSAMTIGPEPKPIWTGAILHTVYITNGPLHTYKLSARVYGGKSDEDINVHNEHTATKLKMVSLYNLMLHPFKHKGHCVVMDSAYMGDDMCQVGQEEWKINMVGTVQSSHTGGGRLGKAVIKEKEIEKGTSPLSTQYQAHYCMLFGLTITLWRLFLISILLLLSKEEWRDEWEIQ